jgi:hypothetical protein
LGRGVDDVKIIMKRIIFYLIAVLIILLLIAILLPAYAPGGRPRGNRFAEMQCRIYLKYASVEQTNSTNFDFSKLPDEIKSIIWIRPENMEFLCKTNFVWTNTPNREVVIVCEKSFDAIPPSIFKWRRHLTQAVGYSDGSASFISPEEFTDLNLNGFVSLSILATNSEFKISKP